MDVASFRGVESKRMKIFWECSFKYVASQLGERNQFRFIDLDCDCDVLDERLGHTGCTEEIEKIRQSNPGRQWDPRVSIGRQKTLNRLATGSGLSILLAAQESTGEQSMQQQQQQRLLHGIHIHPLAISLLWMQGTPSYTTSSRLLKQTCCSS